MSCIICGKESEDEVQGKGRFYDYYNETVECERLFAYGCELEKHWFKYFEESDLNDFGDFVQEVLMETERFKAVDNIDIVFDDAEFPYIVCYPKFPWEADKTTKIFNTKEEMYEAMYEMIKEFVIDSFTLNKFSNEIFYM